MGTTKNDLLEVKITAESTLPLTKVDEGLWTIDEQSSKHFAFFDISDTYPPGHASAAKPEPKAGDAETGSLKKG